MGRLLLQLLFQRACDPCSEEDLAQPNAQGSLLQLQTVHDHIGCLLVCEVFVGATLHWEDAFIAPAEGSKRHMLRESCAVTNTHN